MEVLVSLFVITVVMLLVVLMVVLMVVVVVVVAQMAVLVCGCDGSVGGCGCMVLFPCVHVMTVPEVRSEPLEGFDKVNT